VTGTLRAHGWMFVTALRTERLNLRKNPLVVVNSALLPAVLLIVSAEGGQLTAAKATDLVIAVTLTALWGSTVWISGGVLRRERTYGTLARCVSGVHSPVLVLLGKSLGATLNSVLAILASDAVTALALRLPLRLGNPGWLLLGLLLMVASGTALGALLSCLFLVTRNGLIWSSALMFALGGRLIPSSALPGWLHWVPLVLSLRWVHEFLSQAAAGTVALTPLAVALGLTLSYALLAWLAFSRSVDRSRRDGTLDFS
jgi:ABC-type multidrug transport system permease subunit